MTEQRRGRGVVLTDEGWKKLENALNEWNNQNNFDKPYTIEALIEVTQLDPGTISKVLNREVAVDRRTLERFFRGFNLKLDNDDYSKLNLINNQKINNYNIQLNNPTFYLLPLTFYLLPFTSYLSPLTSHLLPITCLR